MVTKKLVFMIRHLFIFGLFTLKHGKFSSGRWILHAGIVICPATIIIMNSEKGLKYCLIPYLLVIPILLVRPGMTEMIPTLLMWWAEMVNKWPILSILKPKKPTNDTDSNTNTDISNHDSELRSIECLYYWILSQLYLVTWWAWMVATKDRPNEPSISNQRY